MDWFNDRHFFLLAVIIYGVSMIYTVFLWRRGFRKDNRVSYLLLLFGFALHTTSMFMRGMRLNKCPITNLYEATTFAMWALVGIYLVIGLWSRVRFLGAFASPVVFGIGVFALISGVDVVQGASKSEVPHWITSLHAALMALAYGTFGLGSVAGIMYLMQERNLKFHKLKAIFSLMPPIQRLESAVNLLLLAGFVLLTLGLGVGAFGMKHLLNPEQYRGDPKILWSAVVWCAYLALLVMRWKFAQGGRRFAWGAVGTFVFVLLTFWGSSLLSPLHNL